VDTFPERMYDTAVSGMFSNGTEKDGRKMGSVKRDGFRWPVEGEEAAGTLFNGAWPDRHVGRGEYRGLEFLHVNARTVINTVPASSRMSFKYTINAYRGCSHACTYCFARPTHEFLGLGIGEDFERRIVVKVNAVERARAELSSPRWQGDLIAMGTNTDPYQHAEGKYHLTRGIVEVLSERRNPFSILTKSTLILRDLTLLAEAAARTSVRANLSIGTLDREVWRLTEPGTPPPDKRVEAVRRLNDAGVPCGVLVAPVLPGLSDTDEQVTAVVEACRDAGAVGVSVVALHLRPGVREHYLAWLAATRPDLVDLHATRFGRGAYQHRREQERLSAVVARVMGHPPAPGTVLMQPREEVVDPSLEPRPEPAQLALFSAGPDRQEKG
jgi:DNA repair photolyase